MPLLAPCWVCVGERERARSDRRLWGGKEDSLVRTGKGRAADGVRKPFGTVSRRKMLN